MFTAQQFTKALNTAIAAGATTYAHTKMGVRKDGTRYVRGNGQLTLPNALLTALQERGRITASDGRSAKQQFEAFVATTLGLDPTGMTGAQVTSATSSTTDGWFVKDADEHTTCPLTRDGLGAYYYKAKTAPEQGERFAPRPTAGGEGSKDEVVKLLATALKGGKLTQEAHDAALAKHQASKAAVAADEAMTKLAALGLV